MNTVLVWLLVSLPSVSGVHSVYTPTVVVERFDTLEECQRLRKVIENASRGSQLMCAQARVRMQ